MSIRNTLLAVSLLVLTPAMASAAGNPSLGQQKSTVCATCHGATGIAVQPIYPNLAGQHEDYLVMSLKAFRDGGRENAIMSGFATALSDKDIEDLAAWYASQSGLVEIQDK
jgi:cytochrome c553